MRTQIKRIFLGGGVLAAMGLLWAALAGLDAMFPGWEQYLIVPGAAAGILGVAWLLGAMLDDDLGDSHGT